MHIIEEQNLVKEFQVDHTIVFIVCRDSELNPEIFVSTQNKRKRSHFVL